MKSYVVTGGLPVFGHPSGETFEADLSEEQEARLIRRGAIRVGKSGEKAAGGKSGEKEAS